MRSFEPFDDKVIQSFIKGDQIAFDKVYEAYENYIFKLGYQFFNNEESAKDIVQETFLKAYRSRKQLQSSKAIVVWLHRIAYSCCLDTYRKTQVDSSGYMKDDMSEVIEMISDDKDVDNIKQIQLQDAKNAVIEVLEELRPEYKTIAYLRFFEELKHKEIAEITGIDVESIGKYIQRARKQIIKKLGNRGFSKKSCLSIVTTPFLVEFYQEFANDMPSLPKSEVMKLKKELKDKKKKNAKTDFKYLYIVIGISAVLTSGALILHNPETRNKVLSIEKSSITSINYKKELTNHPLKIDVSTDNKNYDYILIDKSRTMTVDVNGEHLIEIVKDDKVVDSKKINITNVDLDIPKVVNEQFDGDKIIFRLEDKDSGINYAGIELLENGVKISAIDIDENMATITIHKDVSKNKIVKVPDNAGNILNININFYK